MGKANSLPKPRFTKAEETFHFRTCGREGARAPAPVVEPVMKRMGFLPNALKLYAIARKIAETLSG